MIRIFLMLLLVPAAVLAETNACITITGGDTITAPGSYCAVSDLAAPPGPGLPTTLRIHNTSDVTIDCNGYQLVGIHYDPASVASLPENEGTGIFIGSSSRVTVRNCRIDGHVAAIYVGRYENGYPRSSDIVIEDNTISNAAYGISMSAEGSSRISGNVFSSILVQGIEAFSPPGQTVVRENAVLRVGDTTYNVGQGAAFNSSLGGWLIVEDNVFSEIVAPPGAGGVAAVDLGPGGGVGTMFARNRVLAPANPAEKGQVTVGLGNTAGNACEGNLTVGYGDTVQPGCPVPDNEQR